ncbi:hypothetical protein SAY87_006643 [Trapa incisa]|uniref:Uncharacterized protein n=1 Tax=Trapa incisa TaxID=236973 RepID=A0AAN7JYW3_9MYRT|nr:hypothetical protein SAY87_006643 [Trapa incisa]
MAVTIKLMSLIVATLGLLSFIFGVIAENKKPAAGTAINMKDVTVCKYNSDPTVALGSLSFAFLIACSVAGFTSVFYPYKGRPVSQSILFQNKSFLVFFLIALGLAGLGGAFLLWPTIVEQLHIDNNVHPLESTSCPTAKTGLLGGAAFLSLDSMLMWLVTLMLVSNTRADYFDEVEGSGKGDGPEVLPGDYDTAGHMKAVA